PGAEFVRFPCYLFKPQGAAGQSVVSFDDCSLIRFSIPGARISSRALGLPAGTNETRFELRNTGTAPLDWQIINSVSWLTAPTNSGAIAPLGSQFITVRVDRSDLTDTATLQGRFIVAGYEYPGRGVSGNAFRPATRAAGGSEILRPATARAGPSEGRQLVRAVSLRDQGRGLGTGGHGYGRGVVRAPRGILQLVCGRHPVAARDERQHGLHVPRLWHRRERLRRAGQSVQERLQGHRDRGRRRQRQHQS